MVIHSFREIFNGMARSLQAVGADNLEIANGLGTMRVVVSRL